MKTVCQILGGARSHVHELVHRPDDWVEAALRAALILLRMPCSLTQCALRSLRCRPMATAVPAHW
jgi:hypothetical protein